MSMVNKDYHIYFSHAVYQIELFCRVVYFSLRNIQPLKRFCRFLYDNFQLAKLLTMDEILCHTAFLVSFIVVSE